MEAWKTAQLWIRDASAVLVVAGAGMSAGLSLQDDEGWEGLPRPPPGFVMDWASSYTSAESMWGREGPKLFRTAMFWPQKLHAGYTALKQIIDTGSKEWFVFTSNVDHRFHIAGFDPVKVYTPQGDMTLLQCMRPCGGHAWDAIPSLKDLVSGNAIDTASWSVRDLTRMPCCPRCKAPAYKHTRHNGLFTHGPHDAHQDRMMSWLEKHGGAGLVVLEIGVGDSEHSAFVNVSYPAEAIARQIKGARLVRMSASEQDASVPPDLVQEARAVGLVGTAEDGLSVLASQRPLEGTVRAAAALDRYPRGTFAPVEVPFKQWLANLRDDPGRFH